VMALEREVLTEVLKHTGGNKSKAARLLKIDYKTIHTKVKKLGITAGGELNDQSNGKNNEEESLGSEQTESPEVFDLSFASQPNSLGMDIPEEKVKQRRLASAA
jgi:hypothetical protein